MRWYLVDRLLECEPGRSAVGIKTFSRSEVFFMDHFPGYPIVPGVLQIEMMANTGGKAIKLARPETLPVLGSVKNAKFYKQVQPGDQCRIYADVLSLKTSFAVVDARVEVDGVKVSQAQIFYGILSSKVIDPNYIDPVIQEWKSRNPAQAELLNVKGENGSADLA